jgi:UTP-glucose-1-phosphate uridylyltransferase
VPTLPSLDSFEAQMHNKKTLLVLAAGMGSRYGGLKQIDPVGPSGEAIIDYSIYDAIRAGFSKVVFIIRHDIEAAFRESIGKRFAGRVQVDYVFQELNLLPPGFTVPPGRTKPWGTAHAILMAADKVKEPFAAINADDFYGPNSYRMLAGHLDSGTSDYAMVGFQLKNTLSEYGSVARGICQLDPANYLNGVTELTKIEKAGAAAKYTSEKGEVMPLTGNEIVSMNIWGFTPNLFNQLRELMVQFLKQSGNEPKSEFYIPTAVNTLVSERKAKVKVLQTPDQWFGVTYREDKPRVVESIQELVKSGAYPANLWK